MEEAAEVILLVHLSLASHSGIQMMSLRESSGGRDDFHLTSLKAYWRFFENHRFLRKEKPWFRHFVLCHQQVSILSRWIFLHWVQVLLLSDL